MSVALTQVVLLNTHLGGRDRDNLELLRHEPTGPVETQIVSSFPLEPVVCFHSLKVSSSALDDLGEVKALGHLDLAHIHQNKVASLRQGEAQTELLKIRAEHIPSLLVSFDLILEEGLLVGQLKTLGNSFLQRRVGTEDDSC